MGFRYKGFYYYNQYSIGFIIRKLWNYLSIHLSIGLSIQLVTTYLFTHAAIFLTIYLSIHLCKYVQTYIYPFIHPSIVPSSYVSIYLVIHSSFYPSIQLTILPSIHYIYTYTNLSIPTIYLSTHLSIQLYENLSLNQSLILIMNFTKNLFINDI